MSGAMTVQTDTDPMDFIAAVEHPTRRADAQTLDRLFREVTGWTPRMWGPTIIGYGAYDYVYETGHSGSCLATGFSPRKANQVLYIMPGYLALGDQLERLGKHKTGKACLYINKLADVDLDVVREIITIGVEALSKKWPVTAT
jgi:hypothetical protein